MNPELAAQDAELLRRAYDQLIDQLNQANDDKRTMAGALRHIELMAEACEASEDELAPILHIVRLPAVRVAMESA